MKKIVLALTTLTLLFSLSSCAIGPVNGLLFTNNRFAGEFNPQNNVSAVKSAKGCQHSFLGLVAVGDAGAGEIARSNGIRKIATIDHQTISVLFLLYRNYCTIVTGE